MDGMSCDCVSLGKQEKTFRKDPVLQNELFPSEVTIFVRLG